jgi:hypothetical protein
MYISYSNFQIMFDQVPGKCKICGEIDRIRKTKHHLVYQTACKEAHQLHRGGMFMLERQKYRQRILHTLRENSIKPKVLSMIMDCMDQNHCETPYLGKMLYI